MNRSLDDEDFEDKTHPTQKTALLKLVVLNQFFGPAEPNFNPRS